MKKTLMMVLLMVPAMSFAKITDFNALITENNEAQRTLHKEVAQGTEATRTALQEKHEQIVVVDAETSDVNVASRSDLLRFKKEIVDHKASKKDLEKRLANEFKSTDLEF